jgi:GDP-L-fucose synthase
MQEYLLPVQGGVLALPSSTALKKVTTHTSFTHPIQSLQLTDPDEVSGYFKKNRPEYLFMVAEKIGGILAKDTYSAQFIYQNLMIQNTLIHQSYTHKVKKLLFLESSCIYPKLCPQPMKEEHLMTGPMEPTNTPYAVAKIMGIEMRWAYNRQYNTRFLPVMPTNFYGPNDDLILKVPMYFRH